jgi:hypothetical protein
LNKPSYLDRFYGFLAKEDSSSILGMGIPLSDVFYIKAALEERMGMKLDVDHVRSALVAEGYTHYGR